MKESEDNDFEELLFIENEETEKQNINKEFHLKIFNYNEKKPDNYILLNQDEDLLLCKEEAIKEINSNKENKEEIKIKELFKGEDNDSFFYINKKETKKHFLKNIIELDKENENSKVDILDNKNKEEMEKIYKEIQLKHPRKIIDGEIRRYPFFSWSGFFCCNKQDYTSLGEAYISYFNTIKLLIIFFLLISIINSVLIKSYSQFSTVYKFPGKNNILNTTLGNTIIRYFNTSIKYFKKEKYDDYLNLKIEIPLDCGENLIDEFVYVQRGYNLKYPIVYLGKVNKEFKYFFPLYPDIFNKRTYKFLNIIDELNDEMRNCHLKNQCNYTYSMYWTYEIEDFPFLYYNYI